MLNMLVVRNVSYSCSLFVPGCRLGRRVVGRPDDDTEKEFVARQQENGKQQSKAMQA